MPLVVFDGGELQTLGDLGHRHATLHVLLVCKNQQARFPQVLEDAAELDKVEKMKLKRKGRL